MNAPYPNLYLTCGISAQEITRLNAYRAHQVFSEPAHITRKIASRLRCLNTSLYKLQILVTQKTVKLSLCFS
jgi:hypothetical protein